VVHYLVAYVSANAVSDIHKPAQYDFNKTYMIVYVSEDLFGCDDQLCHLPYGLVPISHVQRSSLTDSVPFQNPLM
jgi:hypothetical protein